MLDGADRQTQDSERERLMAEIIHLARKMAAGGLVQGTAGNISARHGDEIIITPTSHPYGSMEPNDLCTVDIDGNTLFGARGPSTETPLHTAVYRATDARAVVHTHSLFATTIACTEDLLPAVHYSIVRLGTHRVRVGEYARFGSQELADTTVEALAGGRAVLLRNHGALVYGSSLAQAFDYAELLEWLAQLYWRSKLLGDPRILSDAELDEVAAEGRRLRAARPPGAA
jgi:L-fuculose-phosphate aldolase